MTTTQRRNGSIRAPGDSTVGLKTFAAQLIAALAPLSSGLQKISISGNDMSSFTIRRRYPVLESRQFGKWKNSSNGWYNGTCTSDAYSLAASGKCGKVSVCFDKELT